MDGKYLLKRGRTWYVRFAIPQTVQDIFGKQEFVQSLKTKDFQEAKLLKHKYLERIKYYTEVCRSFVDHGITDSDC